MRKLLTVCFISIALCAQDSVDCIVFSYNRPMQLFAFLESLTTFAKGLGSIFVVYKAENNQYQEAYQEVEQVFVHTHFLNERDYNNNFKQTTLAALACCHSDYLVFGVDDIIVSDEIDFYDCTRALKETGAYGFFLRLGKNIKFDYSQKCSLERPHFLWENGGIYAWRFSDGHLAWMYPHTLDMTVYSKETAAKALIELDYYRPNLLEDMWAQRGWSVFHRVGLCYSCSKIINIPLNRVQNDRENNYMNLYSVQDMLTFFTEGKKIDIQDVYRMENQWTHTEYCPKFVDR